MDHDKMEVDTFHFIPTWCEHLTVKLSHLIGLPQTPHIISHVQAQV